MKNAKQIAGSLGIVCALVLNGVYSPVWAKKWTVTDRLEKLSSEVDEGRQAVELTDKQQADLKKQIADIKESIEKMKARNNGQLSIPDERNIHRKLNDLSVKILRLRLENVYFEK
ncbi:MAG TPA: hypothetical protein V6D08_08140 [Candidatus Obscuribacterales bacterium]